MVPVKCLASSFGLVVCYLFGEVRVFAPVVAAIDLVPMSQRCLRVPGAARTIALQSTVLPVEYGVTQKADVAKRANAYRSTVREPL